MCDIAALFYPFLLLSSFVWEPHQIDFIVLRTILDVLRTIHSPSEQSMFYRTDQRFWPALLRTAPAPASHLRQNTACGSQWLICMLTAWLCLADTHEFQSGVADWSLRLGFDAYAKGRSTNLCAKLHKLSEPYPPFFTLCVINQRVAYGYDHCKTILLC